MRATLGVIASGQIEPTVNFALDAVGNATGSSSGGRAPLTWTHTPVSVPIGCLVFVGNEATSGDLIAGVTYGGVALTEATGSPLLANMGGEGNSEITAWWKSGGLPTGAQTVSVDNTDNTAACNGVSITFKGPNGVAVEDTTTANTAGADPTIALTVANESFCVGMVISGQDTTAGVAVGSGMTQILEVDVGGQVWNFAYKTALVSSNTSLDWTATTEDYAAFAVAIKNT
jgi:hypothetical protein